MQPDTSACFFAMGSGRVGDQGRDASKGTNRRLSVTASGLCDRIFDHDGPQAGVQEPQAGLEHAKVRLKPDEHGSVDSSIEHRSRVIAALVPGASTRASANTQNAP